LALPLAGLKVLDLSRLLPGPYATLVLADLGASVDKLEDPRGGDYLRHAAPLAGDESAYFQGLNRNKRSLSLDLKDPAGVAALRRLVRGYDVLLESFRPGVMDRLGCGYAVLAEENPQLVYCAISGFGQTGPDRARAGHDLNFVARAGSLGCGGPADGAPAMPGGQTADVGSSLFAVAGVLAALHERASTRRGRFVDVSMLEAATAFMHMPLAARLLQRPHGTPLRRGRDALNGGMPCYGVYRTADDRYLAVASIEPKFLGGLLEVVGMPELGSELVDQGAPGEKARRALAAAFEARPLAHWLERFRGRDVCVERVAEGDEVLDDVQLRERGLFAAHEGREWLRTPPMMGLGPVAPPPGLGAHTGVILREAGFSDDEVRALGAS
jgi:alpha-methylacyl-CoA racemase